MLPHHLSHLYGLLPKEAEDEEVLVAESTFTRRSSRLQERTEREMMDALDDLQDEEQEAELESDGRPTQGLRKSEKEFAEEFLNAKHIEDRDERDKLVEEAHQKSHQGTEGTFEELFRAGYFWSDMKRDARRECQKCRKCLRFNVGKRGFHPMRPGVVESPMQRVHADIVGPLLSSDGHTHMLVMIDSATRFTWARPLKDTHAETIAREMVKVFCDWGWPSVMVTDGASNLTGVVMQNILTLIGVEAKTTIPGAHEQNSAVERMIKEVRLVTSKTCDRKPNTWAQMLPMIQAELNDRIGGRTKSAPFSLMLARKRGVYPTEEGTTRDTEALQRRAQDMLEVVYPAVAGIAKTASESACEEANKRRNTTERVFQPGEVVMHEQKIMAKQDDRYDGPFQIKEYNKEVRGYTLETMDGHTVRGGLVSHDLLKPVKNLDGDEDDDGERYEVSSIRDVRQGEGGQEYEVKWKGYPETTWEDESFLVNAERAVQSFWNRRRGEASMIGRRRE